MKTVDRESRELDADALYQAVLRLSEDGGGVRMSWLDIVRAGGSTVKRFGVGNDIDNARIEAAVAILLESGRITLEGPGYKYALRKTEYAAGSTRRRRRPTSSSESAHVASADRMAQGADADGSSGLLSDPLPDVELLGNSPLADVIREEVRAAEESLDRLDELERQIGLERVTARTHAALAHKLVALLADQQPPSEDAQPPSEGAEQSADPA